MAAKSKMLLAVAALGLGGFFFKDSLFAAKVAHSPIGPGPIVALGDSLTAGLGATEGKTYPEQLAKLIDREVVAKGVPGENSGQGLARLKPDALDLKPAAVIVLLGGNDILQRIPAETTIANIDSIASQCEAAGALVAVVTVKPPLMFSTEIGRGLKKVAREHECLYVPDVMDGIMGDPNLMSDPLHPNDAGYEIMAQRISEALGPHLR